MPRFFSCLPRRVTPLLLLMTLLSAMAQAATVSVPESLQPWRDWVLQSHPDAGCPQAADGRRSCAWPGQLQLDVGAQGARFEQGWRLYREAWVTLPGDAQVWPQQVTVNGKPQAVVAREGRAAMQLAAGNYTVAGQLLWVQPPQSLTLPAGTALVALTRDGHKVEHPNLMAGGQLFLSSTDSSTGSNEQDQLQLRVFTKLSDDVPMRMERVLRLGVSGSERELKLGRALLADTELTNLQSSLPARIEKDGTLRVQARAGEWEITLRARVTKDAREFRMQAATPEWPAQEIWSFEAAPQLRGIKLVGADSVDTSQLDIPPDWAQLPTYLLQADTTLTLEEQYRGDTKPRANTLSLVRNLWLDFNGEGFTAGDQMDGSLNRGWRLSVDPALQLGRVSVHGEPQLVTQLPGEKSAGVEIRDRASVDLYAVSRQGAAREFSAVGWQQDVDSLQANLHLPPGWRLWHASGVDSVSQSFVSRWDLWDIFLVMISVVAILRLLGAAAAAIALAVLALSFHQSTALLWLGLPVLALVAVRQLIESDAWRARINVVIGIFALLFVAAFLKHAVYLVRVSIYPQLEQSRSITESLDYAYSSRVSDAEAPMPAAAPQMMEMAADTAAGAAEEVIVTAQRKTMPVRTMVKRAEPVYDSSAIVQTGPGEPNWRWQQVALNWSGPVSAEQTVHLYLTSPLITRIINFTQLLLWCALMLVLARGRLRVSSASLSTTAASAVVLLLMSFATPNPAHAADFPPADMLQELERRLTAAPECTPDCASINEGRLELNAERLTLRLRIDALAAVQVPLPGGYQGFLPQQVLVDGSSDVALMHDENGVLKIALDAGRHDVVMSGAVTAERLSLAFAQPVRRFVVTQDGSWTVSGLQDAVLTNNVVELRRTVRVDASSAAQLKADPVAPFVRIDRQFVFRHDWRVSTTVARLAPDDVAISVRVPLLPGESLTEGAYKVAADHTVEVTIAAGEQFASWSSTLVPTTSLQLTSASQNVFVERWMFEASPQWHLQWQGFAPAKTDMLAFYPWPGESLSVDVLRPAAVTGAQQTVEEVLLASKPGNRVASHTLTLNVRASQAGDYRVVLPEGARVETLMADGQVLNTEDDRHVVLPVRPGVQKLQIGFSEERAMTLRWLTPAVTLAGPSTNIALQLTLPQDRWLLWANGPAMGPALLYWGVLLVIVAIAVVLGFICDQHPDTPPLRVHHWVLLGLGMSTANSVGSIVVVAWLFALAFRARFAARLSDGAFHVVQILMILLSAIALITLLATIPMSLLSSPNMQVVGNGSSSYLLQWFADRFAAQLPQASVISVPIWAYRVVMLVWSLWLAAQLLHWLRWGWGCLTAGGFWRESAPQSTASKPVAPK